VSVSALHTTFIILGGMIPKNLSIGQIDQRCLLVLSFPGEVLCFLPTAMQASSEVG
jgi:hypothetical protein